MDAIEKAHGWNITSMSGSELCMTYRKEIELVFDVAALESSELTSQIELHAIDKDDESTFSHDKTFFVTSIRDHIRALPQGSTSIAQMLRMVSAAWDKAGLVFAEIGKVNVMFPTKVASTSDTNMCISTSIMLPPLQTRVEVDFTLSRLVGEEGVDFGIASQARVVYGETFNVGKLEEYMATRVGNKLGALEEEWVDVLTELRERLIARGRK